MPVITSLSNPTVKHLVKLQRDADARREAGAFCVETARELARALDSGFEARAIYRCEPDSEQASLIERSGVAGESLVDVSPDVLAKATYRGLRHGLVAELADRRATLAGLEPGERPLLLVCSGLDKPGNVGAVLRSADAAGADAVLIDRPGYDLFNPNCVRASTGAVFAVPIVCETGAALRRWLAARSVLVIAATPEAPMTHLHVTMRGPTALVVGSEAEGLDESWRQAADLCLAIPMRGRAADSLNVSVTAGVLLFEALRQRTG